MDEIDYDKYEIVWWKEWDDADHIEKFEKVKKLPFIGEMITLCKMDNEKFSEEDKKHSIAMMLNSFFEDLMYYTYEKARPTKIGDKH